MNPIRSVLLAVTGLVLIGSSVHAEEKTAYIETAQERANHEVVEKFSRMLFSGQLRQAVETYLSPDYVDHSHLVQLRTGKARPGREEFITFFSSMMGGGAPGADAMAAGGSPQGGAAPAGGGMSAEMGVMNIGQIRVNDEMVTQYGPEGADIFRVVNGKITDHWDASPMEPVSLIGENYVGQSNQGTAAQGGMSAAPAAKK